MENRTATQILFRQGHYSQVLAGVYSPEAHGGEAVSLAGSLALSGYLPQAEKVLRQSRLTDVELREAQVLLVLACCRSRLFRKAKLLVGRMSFRSEIRSTSPEEFGLSLLALGIYRFSTGRMGKAEFSLRHAKSFLSDPYYLGLVFEFLGHTEIALGRISSGLESFGKGSREVIKYGGSTFNAAFVILYQCRCILPVHEAVAKLESCLAQGLSKSMSVLFLLEHSLLLLKLGRLREAKVSLDAAVNSGLELGDVRLVSKVHLGVGRWHLVKSDLALAKACFFAARQLLDPLFDMALLQEIFEWESRLGNAVTDIGAMVRLTSIPLREEAMGGNGTPATTCGPLSPRQQAILSRLSREGFVTVPMCQKWSCVSEITAYRDLADLVKKGYLAREGKGRATRYSLS